MPQTRRLRALGPGNGGYQRTLRTVDERLRLAQHLGTLERDSDVDARLPQVMVKRTLV